jgi:hypothetical protein
LHLIMQLVTVEVTVLVSGVIGVGACAKAMLAVRTVDESAAVAASIIVMRRMIASDKTELTSYASIMTQKIGPHRAKAHNPGRQLRSSGRDRDAIHSHRIAV